ncbi:MAG: hypothetical protein ABSG68_18550 [Thermoguttaceae bacterium]
MDQSAFEVTEPIVDELGKITDQMLGLQEIDRVRSLLAEMSRALGERYSVAFNMEIEVWDSKREDVLPLLQAGLCAMPGKEPFQTRDQPPMQRYVVDGDIQVVPQDHCPNCWGNWDCRKTRSCRHCGVTLGREVKLLLDMDACPACDTGRVSVNAPTCTECGYTVNPSIAVWG